MNPYTVFLLLALLFIAINKQIEVPPIFDSSPLSLKLSALKEIQEPDFAFENVYKRSVQRIENQSVSNFPPCKENKPEIEFDILDQVTFAGIPQKPSLIYNFDDIRYSQFLLDVYYEDLTIYLMFKNGRAAIVKMESNTRISQKEMIDVIDIDKEAHLEKGYFIKVGGDVLFVNSKYVIKMKGKNASVVKGYLGKDKLESVAAIDNGYFVVMDEAIGITVYKYDGESVKNVSNFDGTFFNPITKIVQLEDIVYHPEKQTLILLDYFTGVQTFKVTTTSENFTLSPTEPITKEKYCHLLYLHGNNLYVSCRKMIKYNVENFPKVEQSILPFPNVEIKEIYEIDNIVAFVGRNSFSVLYLDRLVNYYEDGNVDRLMFHEDVFINANEAGVDIGKIKIIKPYISCSTEEEEFVGETKLVFKTIAECNSSYFEKYQVNSSEISNIEEDDVCIYTVYRSAYFWKVGEIHVTAFVWVGIGIFVFLVLVVIACFVKNIKIQRIQSLLDQYANANVSDSAKHQQFADEMEVVESDKDLKPKAKQDSEGKEGEEQMHDIS